MIKLNKQIGQLLGLLDWNSDFKAILASVSAAGDPTAFNVVDLTEQRRSRHKSKLRQVGARVRLQYFSCFGSLKRHKSKLLIKILELNIQT